MTKSSLSYWQGHVLATPGKSRLWCFNETLDSRRGRAALLGHQEYAVAATKQHDARSILINCDIHVIMFQMLLTLLADKMSDHIE
eukprot:scaffold657694_cov59-Prasinocladus_malaysianus.AAC.1